MNTRTARISRHDRATAARFAERYSERHGDVGRVIEREVIGANVGLNGYTTLPQAKRLARELRLAPGTRLLDIGCGNGWPGIFLAESARCSVVLTDVPAEAVHRTARRANRSRARRRLATVRASALNLPFRPATFDAVVHTDVMC